MSPEEQKEVLSKRVATKKIRCKNWPNCNDPTCEYSHPTETVSIILLLIFFYISALFSRNVLLEIIVVIYIQVSLVNMDIIVQE